MTKNWATLMGLAVVTAGVTVSGAAQALPQFTFAPSAVGLTGSSFTADNIQISDFSTITLTPVAGSSTMQTFTDAGTLAISNFQIGNGSPVSTPGLNSTYGLYLNFQGTGTQTTTSPGNASGAFDTLQFTLNAYNRAPGDTINYLPGNSTPTDNGVVVTPIALAAGGLISGGVATLFGSPAASATTTFTLEPGEQPFFASPVPFYNLAFSAFINTTSEFTTIGNNGGFVITQGGGTINFGTASTPVPEPRSLMLLGASLAAVGLIRRRKRS